jgi:hypothetical protein
VYINEKDFEVVLCHAVAQVLKQELGDNKLLEVG